MIIGVLGPTGSYSEKAAEKWIAKNGGSKVVYLQYYDDILDTVSAVLDKTVDLGIIPVENSLEGSVGITLDMLNENDLKIVGEMVVTIKHCLLSKGKLSDIKIILSHPQALAQCRKFLKKRFENAEIRTTGSTSHAAKLANEFEEMAAIASRESAQMYGLKVLIQDIQDKKENHTRFIVIKAGSTVKTPSEPEPSLSENVSYKTSIIVYLKKDRPGALYELLGKFAKRGINLTRIESRPSKRALGDYIFYIDFEGHINDEVIRNALDNITSSVGMLKILGSYPQCAKEGTTTR
ncbi:MAG: prephenate dehydratase [Methanosarcinaceae archaeon]|nr:prephenate dehydratase [Methanosarcinaceae archaeon]